MSKINNIIIKELRTRLILNQVASRADAIQYLESENLLTHHKRKSNKRKTETWFVLDSGNQ